MKIWFEIIVWKFGILNLRIRIQNFLEMLDSESI